VPGDHTRLRWVWIIACAAGVACALTGSVLLGEHPSASAAAGSPSPATPRCAAQPLAVTLRHGEAAGPVAGAYLAFTNRSRRTCFVMGWPAVTGITRSGGRKTAVHVRTTQFGPNVRGCHEWTSGRQPERTPCSMGTDRRSRPDLRTVLPEVHREGAAQQAGSQLVCVNSGTQRISPQLRLPTCINGRREQPALPWITGRQQVALHLLVSFQPSVWPGLLALGWGELRRPHRALRIKTCRRLRRSVGNACHWRRVAKAA
jgi:hypothetical protein